MRHVILNPKGTINMFNQLFMQRDVNDMKVVK